MAKVRVHVLTEYRSPNSCAFNYPLLIHRPFFKNRGIDIHFFDFINDRIYGCDAIFINGKFFRSWHAKRKKELFDVLSGFRKRKNRLIWFDTTDSTGTTQFNIMPFADGYYKGQLLKDRSLYGRNFYGHRVYTDYYKKRFGIVDKEESVESSDREESVNTPLDSQHAHKLHLSWNSAMNEWGSYNYSYAGFVARVRCHLPFKVKYTISFVRVDTERKIDISGRIGLSHSRETVRYQRQRIGEILKNRFSVDISKVSRGRYINELINSRIAVSPFGWGEISCRDFDVIISGALLFKPDMSYLETWPPLYVNNETYVSHSWDMRDFEERLRDILRDKDRLTAIAKKAQDVYAYYLYGDGKLEYCDKVVGIIHGKG